MLKSVGPDSGVQRTPAFTQAYEHYRKHKIFGAENREQIIRDLNFLLASRDPSKKKTLDLSVMEIVDSMELAKVLSDQEILELIDMLGAD